MIDTNIVPSRERDQSDDSFIFRRRPAQQRNNDLAYFLDNLTYDTSINYLKTTFKSICLNIIMKHIPTKSNLSRFNQP